MHVQADIEHARSRFFSQHSATGEQHARATTCDADHKADIGVAARKHLRRPATRQPSHNPPNPRSVTRLQATIERASEALAQQRQSTPRPLHRSPASSDSLSCNAPPALARRKWFFMMVITAADRDGLKSASWLFAPKSSGRRAPMDRRHEDSGSACRRRRRRGERAEARS